MIYEEEHEKTPWCVTYEIPYGHVIGVMRRYKFKFSAQKWAQKQDLYVRPYKWACDNIDAQTDWSAFDVPQ